MESPAAIGADGATRLPVGHWLDLGKARLSALVVWTAAIGFILAAFSGASGAHARGVTMVLALAATAIGVFLCAASANAFNQIIEHPRDARMLRTRTRPLPSGALSRPHAVAVAIGAGVAGIVVLAIGTTRLATALAAATILLYVAVYTPLKTRTTLNTLVGAVVGAIPPLIGWSAAAGTLDPGAWVLAALLFIWQIPHFLALAWMYREDYARGGFRMLPLVDPCGHVTFRVVLLTSILLIPIGLCAALTGVGGWIAVAGATALGGWMTWLAIRLLRETGDAAARRVFLGSLLYLPIVLLLLALDPSRVAGVPPLIHREIGAPPLFTAGQRAAEPGDRRTTPGERMLLSRRQPADH